MSFRKKKNWPGQTLKLQKGSHLFSCLQSQHHCSFIIPAGGLKCHIITARGMARLQKPEANQCQKQRGNSKQLTPLPYFQHRRGKQNNNSSETWHSRLPIIHSEARWRSHYELQIHIAGQWRQTEGEPFSSKELWGKWHNTDEGLLKLNYSPVIRPARESLARAA